MKYALFALIVRIFQSIDAEWGSEQFKLLIESELDGSSAKWRKLVLQAIDYIRNAYRAEDKKYRQVKQPLPIVYFFKSQTYIDKIFPNAVAQNLRAAARVVLWRRP